MPYIHWESHLGQLRAGATLENIRKETTKTRLCRSRNSWRRAEDLNGLNRESKGNPSQTPDGTQELPSAANTKPEDNDDELLKKYLFKRWPLHLRRTLVQSYYSYLADTKTRDDNQVAMRAQSRKLRQETKYITDYVSKQTRKSAKHTKPVPNGEQRPDQINKDTPNPDRSTQMSKAKSMSEKEQSPGQVNEDAPDPDNNRPVVMVDQLWLWVVSKGRPTFAFFDRS
jgi:hypothetical protein